MSFKRAFIALLFLQLIYLAAETGFGLELPGSTLVPIVFVVTGLILVLRISTRWIARKLLWRVRHRLLVTYFLVGVVPIVLILAMAGIASYMLLGQTTSYLVSTNLEHQYGLFQSAAYDIALNTAYGMKTQRADAAAAEFIAGVQARLPGLQVVVRANGQTFSIPPGSVWNDVAPWIKSDFKGLVTGSPAGIVLAAASRVQTPGAEVEVLAYEPLNNEAMTALMQGLGRMVFINVNGREDPDPTDQALSPESSGPFWDIPIRWFLPLQAAKLADGTSDTVVALVSPRPSLVLGRLFGANLRVPSNATVGSVAGVLLLIAAGLLLTVEAVALVFTAGLTRSITRSVHDLYQGTQAVETGNFSHRVPIRSGDQLSALAGSFNEMTARVQKLIADVAEKEKLELEIQIAREVQQLLIPKEIPRIKTLELSGLWTPALVVSGDYYDFVPLENHRTALVIADISGKGISAALLMAGLQSSLRAHLSVARDLSPAAIVAGLNRQLYANSAPEKFATVFCSIYDNEAGTLHYTNAGHLPPILVRRGQTMRMETTGTLVGMFPDVEYLEANIQLEFGDLVVAFTDGITECENEAGEQFGEERLKKLLIEHASRPLDQMMAMITETLESWSHDLVNQDDRTIFAARCV